MPAAIARMLWYLGPHALFVSIRRVSLFPLTASSAHLVHFLFEALAFAFGGWLWRRARRASPEKQSALGFPVIVGCLFGAGTGNKLVAWIQDPHPLFSNGVWMLPGQSMVGGLLGGWIGIELAKWIVGVRRSTGDDFWLPMLLGIAIGRLGCFLSGLHEATYGLPTSLPWGVDLGDGIPRHPAPLYEIVFVLALAMALARAKLPLQVGLRFRLAASGYLLWRLGIEAIKPAPWSWSGLSGIQWVCVAGLLWSMTESVKLWRSGR
jgi:prolipoprotein diacylglyceryltransferase